jgi:hypothetical protein
MSMPFPFRRSQKVKSPRQLARARRCRKIAACVAPFLIIPALTVIPAASGGAAAAAAATTTPLPRINMKVLLITTNPASSADAEPAFGDWQNTLKREGVPFDTVVTNPTDAGTAPANGTTPLPALTSTLADGTSVANYEAVIVTGSGDEGLSTAQWTTLQTYEQQFYIRQLTAYASPGPDYGLNTVSGGEAMDGTTPISLTSDGNTTFPYLKSVSLDTGTYGYEASPLTAASTPALPAAASVDSLITGPSDSSLLGIYTSTDGRQTMYQTFDENQYMLQSELLRHGELAWLTRGTYFGDQRNYLETDIDDNFLSDDVWSVAGNATTAAHSTDFDAGDAIREVPSDVSTAAQWSASNNFRVDMLFNGGGSVQAADGCTEATSGDGGSGGTAMDCTGVATGTDPLLAAFQANDPATGKPYTDDFYWINHTWDHPNIDQGCATQDYIEAEINQNTAWASAVASNGNPTTGGLGLTPSTTNALGSENPNVVVTGEHSGLANLVPGNPGQVDPPAFDDQNPNTTGGTLAAGQYEYAVADQFNTAAPGATPVAGSGESAASITSPITVTAPDQTVNLSWGAVCKAADYIVYRAPVTGTTVGAWSQIGTVAADPTTDFTNPTGNSTTNTAGGGAVTKTFTDTGTVGTPAPSGEPQTEGNADESAYEQNPNLDAAFAGTSGGGIKYFGADASKPYPNASDAAFATGSAPAGQYAAGATFPDAGATGIPRYPTNIYYNVSTNAEEIDEYETLYDAPSTTGATGACVDSSTTTCSPAGTAFTIGDIVSSVDQGMFQHLMGNDPLPDYFHQTNLMSSTANGATGDGDGLYYETMNPLLAQYHQYFQDNAPIEQLTMAQIGDLLNQQANWATANNSQVTGYIQGNMVTVNNSGSSVELPLTGTNVGTAYAGSVSGWTQAPAGASTYTALAAWPTAPTAPVAVQAPTGSAPSIGNTPMPGPTPAPATPSTTPTTTPPTQHVVKPASVRRVVQIAPKTVAVKHGRVTVSLKCEAAKGQVCSGAFTLKLSGKAVTRTFRIKANRIKRIATRLPKPGIVVATRSSQNHPLHATLRIWTKQSSGSARISRGRLTIKN